MSKENNNVRAFHDKFGIVNPTTPHFLNEKVLGFRIKFMYEELKEFIQASGYNIEVALGHHPGNEFQMMKPEQDMHGMADALVDLVYVAHGTALMMGIPWEKIWDEVQKKNMLKERATSADQSKRGSKLDVIKPKGWTPPDHSAALGKGPYPTTQES